MKGIRIAQNIPLAKGPQDLNLAMMFLLKATIYSESLTKYKEAAKVYQKAKKIITDIEGARMNTQTLLDNVVR